MRWMSLWLVMACSDEEGPKEETDLVLNDTGPVETDGVETDVIETESDVVETDVVESDTRSPELIACDEMLNPWDSGDSGYWAALWPCCDLWVAECEAANDSGCEWICDG